jgi:hypothetical protein
LYKRGKQQQNLQTKELGDIQIELAGPVSKDRDRRSTNPNTAERSINTSELKRSPAQLQKVVWGLASCVWLNLPRCWVKLEEVLVHIFTNLKNRRHVTTAITVVWCTEDCDNILVLYGE